MSDAAAVSPVLHEPLLHEPWKDRGRQREAVLFGLWLFLASELMLFGGLFLAYAVCRWIDTAGFTEAARRTNLLFGASNTALLLTSSVAIAVAGRAAEVKALRLAEAAIWVTIALGLAFLAVKGLEYRQDLREGLWPDAAFPVATPGARLFFGLYWTMTSVHVCHLLAGLGLLGRLAWMARRGVLVENADSLEVGSLYWGLVDVIWVAIFPVLYLVGR